MAVEYGAKLTLQDNFTATMKHAIQTQTKFRQDVEKTKEEMRKAYNQKLSINVKNSTAVAALKRVEKALAPLRQKVVTMVAAKDMATERLQKIRAQMQALTGQQFTPGLGLKDKLTGSLKGILSKAKDLIANPLVATLSLAAAGAGAVKMMQMGGTLEGQKISIKHFLGVNNPNLNDNQLNAMRDQYMNDLRGNADKTPFETDQIVAAGTRAITIAGGNTKQAMALLKMSENMAALTTGKTPMDAMEALADAAVGEMERMKEFGFKSGAEQFQASGGDLTKLKDIKGRTVDSIFGGGVEKFGQTGFGLWSTMISKVKGTMTNTGEQMLNTLKPIMKDIIDFLAKSKPALDAMGQTFANAFGRGVMFAKTLVQNIAPFMPAIKTFLEQVGNIVRPLLSFAGGVFSFLWDMAQAFMPYMVDAWNAMYPILLNVATTAAAIGGWLAAMGEHANVLVPIVISLGAAWAAYNGYLALTKIHLLAAKAAMVVFNVITSLNPIGLIVAAVAALVALGVILYNRWKPFHDLIAKIVDGVKVVFGIKGTKKVAEQKGGTPSFAPVGIPGMPDMKGTKLAGGDLTNLATSTAATQQVTVSIPKFADNIVIRDERDIKKLAAELAKYLQDASNNRGSLVPAHK